VLNGREGRRSVEVIEAIYESAKTGKIVKLS
jgi:predicted dehydrogenase